MRDSSVFVGSSTEGLDFARAIRDLLADDAETTLWNEGLFAPGKTFIETLVNSLARFDFAVLLLTADDFVQSRDVETFGPRDNVIFELGLFMGGLGRDRTFVVHESNSTLKIPSDLLGVATAQYRWPRADRDHRAAVGPCCDNIRRVIRDLGATQARTGREITAMKARQNSTESEVRALQVVLKGLLTVYEYDKLLGLATDGPFMVRFRFRMWEELRRLSLMHYIQPRSGRTTNSVRERKGSSSTFDLREYYRVTREGLEYIKLRNEMSEADGA